MVTEEQEREICEPVLATLHSKQPWPRSLCGLPPSRCPGLLGTGSLILPCLCLSRHECCLPKQLNIHPWALPSSRVIQGPHGPGSNIRASALLS